MPAPARLMRHEGWIPGRGCYAAATGMTEETQIGAVLFSRISIVIEIYLASKSPRRRQLLDQLRVKYEVLDVEVAEHWDGKETPSDYVMRLALEKARAGKKVAPRPLPVLGADTEVVLDDCVLGKPADRNDAMRMLMSLSGRTHLVYSAVALIHEREEARVNVSHVTFRPLTGEECARYCNLDEPYDKAGAYAVQGGAAAFITGLEGSYSGVMGLPLDETAELLQAIIR